MPRLCATLLTGLHWHVAQAHHTESLLRADTLLMRTLTHANWHCADTRC